MRIAISLTSNKFFGNAYQAEICDANLQQSVPLRQKIANLIALEYTSPAVTPTNLAGRAIAIFKKWVANDNSRIAMLASKNIINSIAHENDNKFRGMFYNLISICEHIDIPFSRLSEVKQKIAADELSKLGVIDYLKAVKLDFGRSNILLQDIGHIVQAMSSNGKKHLQITLNLQSRNIGDGEASMIATILKNSRVVDLNLELNMIGTEGAKSIANALGKSNVVNLNLAYNNLGDDGAIVIANALPHSKVTSLNLESNNIKTLGAQAIAGALPHSKVENLDLGLNDIRDSGKKFLTSALPYSNVKYLNIEFNCSDQRQMSRIDTDSSGKQA